MQGLSRVADSDHPAIDEHIQRVQSEREGRTSRDSGEAAHAVAECRTELREKISVRELRAARGLVGGTAPDQRVVRLTRAAAWQQRDRTFASESFPRDV